MTAELRKTGISVVGDMPWGTHFCYFYETKQDLLDILVPYFKVGLENNEFCLWVISNSELLTMQEAGSALRKALPDLDRYLAEGSIEVVAHDEWFLYEGAFDLRRVANRFKEKLDEALARGYTGMRVNGSPAWLQKKDGEELREFEKELDKLFPKERVIASCTYPIGESSADFLLDVARNHQFAIARRHGNWDVLEAPELMQAKREIKRLNEELEQRVIERTGELAAANEELRREISERKRAEDALKESRQRLEEAQRIAHVGHWGRDLRTGAITWSDEIYNILGLERQVSPPTVWEHMIHPEDRERISLAIEEAQRGIGRYDVEYRIVRPDGEVRFLHSQGDIIRDEHGELCRAFGIAQDITERKQAEALLHARGQEFRAFVENTPDQVIKYDREFRRAYVNPAVAKAYDLPVEMLIGKPIGSVIRDAGLNVRADQVAQIRQRIAAVFDTGESSVYELTWPLPTGRRYYSVRYFPEFDLNGVVIYVWGISRDITELKETQHQILALTENSPDLIARFDRDGRYLYLNSAVEKLIGIPAHELRSKRIGETLLNRVYPAMLNDLLSLRGAIDKVFASGSAIETEIQVTLLAGERNFNVRLIPERDEAGQVSSVLHIGRDITERKRAEKALRLSEERFAKAFNANPDPISIIRHSDSSILEINDRWESVFGYTRKEVIERTAAELNLYVNPDDRLKLRDLFKEQGFLREQETDCLNKSGDVRHISMSAEQIVVNDEPCIIFLMRDITDRKRAEEALRQAEEKYHGIFENAIEGIFQTTPDGQYITVNPALARMLGYDSPQELMTSRTDIGQQQYVEPERRSDFKRLLEEHSVVQGFEYQAYRKDGSKIWLSDNGRAVQDESGAVLYYEGFTEDITERKLAEEALRRSEDHLRLVVDTIPMMAWSLGPDGTVDFLNQRWIDYTGLSLEQFVEEPTRPIHHEDIPRALEKWRTYMAAGEAYENESRLRRADGEFRWFLVRTAPLRDEQGNLVKWYGVSIDIQERKQAEEMLQTFSQRLIEVQEAERRRVARELHDEIGQALTAIKINLQTVQHSADASTLAPQLNESAGIVDRALQQVRDLSFNLRPSLLDDLGLIAALRWYVDSEARRAGLIPEFVADLSETRLPSELETACFRITQEALTNVVRHAQARRIWVELRQRGSELHLTIRDDGIGFDVGALWRRRMSDAGLGLQGMQERALILNGKIEIKSVPAHGTEIHVWFSLTIIPSSANEEGGNAP
jgi:PAS domain S-box-containing protein